MNSDSNLRKRCGFCGEAIPVNASRCPYCGSVLEISLENDYQIASKERQAPVNEDGIIPDSQIPSELQKPQEPQSSQGTQSPPKYQDTPEQPMNCGTGPMSRNGAGQQAEHRDPVQSAEGTFHNYEYIPYGGRGGSGSMKPLSNGMKVFLTVLFTILPGIGQLAGIITAIVFMNNEGDSDRKSFGVALLVSSLVMFVLACIGCFLLVIFASSMNQYTY